MHAFLPMLSLVAGLATAPARPGQAFRLQSESTNLALANAEISVVGRRGSVLADAAGRFTLEPAPATPFVVIVILANGRVARPVTVNDLEPGAEQVLEIQPAVSEAVTILGLAPQVDVSAGSASTFISGGDISLRQPSTLVDTLETVPGIHFVSEGQAAVPSVRGLARGRTLILVDGGRASTERRAGPNASFLDPASLADVQVARGPASVAYGSDAFGGVIALRTRRPSREARIGVQFAGTLGDTTPEYRGELTVSRGYGHGGVLVSIRTRDFDDYSSPEGLVPNSGWRDRGVRIGWEHETTRGQWFVGWQSDAGRDLGRPRSDTASVRVTSPRDDSHRLTVNYTGDSTGPFGRMAFAALIGRSRQTTEQDRAANPMRPRSVERNELSFTELQLRATADRTFGRARVQLGSDLLGRYGFEATDVVDRYNQSGAFVDTTTTQSVGDASRTGVGLFVQFDVPLAQRLDLSGGVRADYVSNRNRGGFFGDRSVSNGAVAGLAALTLTVSDGLTVSAQMARGFRDPILSDRFYRGPVGRGFLVGNPDLEPETSLQFDGGVRYVRGGLRAAASFYRYRISDLIELYSAPQNQFLFRNRPRAVLRGVEFELQADVGRGLSVEGTAHVARGRDADDGTALDDIPPATVALTLRHAREGRWQSYVRLAGIDAHNAAGPGEVPTPGYVMLDAGAGFRLSPNVEIRAVARNLLNELYYGSAGPRWVYAPGRHGAITMVVGY